MIVVPENRAEWEQMAGFMLEAAGVNPTMDARYIGWVSEKKLKMVVGFNNFLGRTCQMHVAMADGFGYTPRVMLAKCFDYAFNRANCLTVLGVVSSANERAVRYDTHLGFKELLRLPQHHEDGADMILLGMTRDTCRYLTAHSKLH